MKKQFFKILCILFLSLTSSISFGKSIYLSSTGIDSNDGLTALTSVASFSRAQTLAASGDTIQVSGMIDFSIDPANTASPKVGIPLAKTLTILGTSSATDGFDGNNVTRFIVANVSAYTLTLKNLKLYRGAYTNTVTTGGGGALLIGGSSVIGENLVFDSNTSSGTTTNNGAAILVGSTKGLSFKNCVFSNNTAAKTGAIYINDAAYANVSYRFEGCSFISNVAQGSLGGTAIFLRTTAVSTGLKVYLINCTIAKNKVAASVDGGALYLYAGLADTEVNITNCTITENTTAGSANNGAGIRVYTTATGQFLGKLFINNSIIEGNYASGGIFSDLSISNPVAPTANNLMIHNSIIGRNANVAVPVDCYPGNNRFNYLTGTSTMFDLIAKFAAFDEIRKIYPLLINSPAINYGDAQYLQSLNVITDQVGTIRMFTENKCYAGAIEFTGLPQTYEGGDGYAYKHFIMYGQSLSTGHQSYPVISTENIPGNYMLGDQIWVNYGNTSFITFKPLIGTISNTFKTQSNIMNRTAGTIAECPLFGAVNHLQLKQTGEKILATSCGTSGMSIEQLSKESQTKTLYNDFTKTIKYSAYTAQITGSTISCPAIFWMQGEWNYQSNGEGLTTGSLPTSDKAAYKALMLTLKNNMQMDIKTEYGQSEKPLFICYQTGVSYIKGKEQTIGMAQLEASNENSDIICAGSVAQMTDRGGHLDANGYRWYGEMLGKVYYKTNVLKEIFKPLQPKEISRTTTPNELKIQFLVPVKPLVMDSLILPKAKDYGFEVYANDVKQTITSVKIIDDCVYLTCSAPLTGVLEVIYAGQNSAGNGNLRDSDPYQSFFKYIDLDKKNPDGSFIYPRDATETSLRPNYEPKDASGNVIYDQPYPLYNFGVSFYYKMNIDQQTLVVPNLGSSVINAVPIFDKQSGFKIYQSGDYLIFETSDKLINKIELYNISGNLIKSFNGATYKYSISGLSKGIYIVKVLSKDEICSQKILIH